MLDFHQLFSKHFLAHHGPDHFEVARTLTNLGITYGDLGNHKKKKELFERALAIQEKHYGLDHFQVAIAMTNLGNTYGALGDHKKAKELLEQASFILEKHHSHDYF
ncbi:tetratricopeptide repeat protein [Wolbachia endosymbiont (group A) of Nomada goodeniana]|uniref:tetratricopeptide repeat protein n=1 Tax=Wolbachia endosymbiont (group A) of Nomada goodeniana TaxID=3066207 RepID=UPI00333F4255